MSGIGTTLPFKLGRMSGRLPSISANQASGCFVGFREVDRATQVTAMGADWPEAERRLPGIPHVKADVATGRRPRQLPTRTRLVSCHERLPLTEPHSYFWPLSRPGTRKIKARMRAISWSEQAIRCST